MMLSVCIYLFFGKIFWTPLQLTLEKADTVKIVVDLFIIN